MIHVYPNPGNGDITISLEGQQDNATVQIYNLQGQKIMQSNLSAGKTELDLAGNAAGTYLYRVAGVNGVACSTGSFIIQ